MNLKSKIYLDYASATPLDTIVADVMRDYATKHYYNPSALYLSAKSVHKDLEQARADIASWLGARPSEITFTSGGTESDNLAVSGIMQQHKGANAIFSAVEHEAIRAPMQQYDAKEAPVKPNGLLDLLALKELINDKTVLISVMLANNEIGTIQPVKSLTAMVSEVRADRQKRGIKMPLYVHTDACQAAAYLDLHTSRYGVDLMTINAGKIYGPKQCGALFVKAGVILKPQIVGGGQELGLRSGTENVANILGFAKALGRVQKHRAGESKRLQDIQQSVVKKLATKLPNIVINGTQKHRLPNNIHITVPGTDNERLLMELDERGIMVAVGSACSASSDEPSHVLKAIGLSDKQAQSSLRVTMGRKTTAKDMAIFVEQLTDILKL